MIFLVATTANSAIGAYQGFHGTAWFQKGQTKTETASVIGKDTFMSPVDVFGKYPAYRWSGKGRGDGR